MEAQLMNVTDLRSRVRRLEQLVAGLSRGSLLWRDCNAPVLYVDRLKYLEGADRAIHGLEKARVAMAKACRRIEENPSGL
jgi:hypothetical protein